MNEKLPAGAMSPEDAKRRICPLSEMHRFCANVDCMMWRGVSVHVSIAGRWQSRPGPHPDGLGYCGLAGRPDFHSKQSPNGLPTIEKGE